MRILLVLIILIGGAILVYQLTRAIFPATSGEEAIVVQAPQPAPAIVIPEWKVFANPQFAYTIQYPPDTEPEVYAPSDIYAHFVTFIKETAEEETEEVTREERFSLSIRRSLLADEVAFQRSRVDGRTGQSLANQSSFSHQGLPAVRLDYQNLSLVSVERSPYVFTFYFPRLTDPKLVNSVLSTLTFQ